jgi:peptidoglycan/xylan/chitin deacetylase (PgdA/CDA1 family)
MERLNGVCGCLLTFHRAASSADWPHLPNREFYLDALFLEQLLDTFGVRHWDVVTMEEAVRRTAQGTNRRFVNISVDDTYRDTYEIVVPIFQRAGVPVTLFVTTGMPDDTLCLWEAGLETILAENTTLAVPDGAGSTVLQLQNASQRREAFTMLRATWEKMHPEQIYYQLCALNGYDPAELRARHAISWQMLKSLRHNPFVELGAHTMRHPHVSTLSETDALFEIKGSRTRLEAKLGVEIRHFAFPFGRAADCGPRDFALAREAGFTSAATTRKGLLRQSKAFDPYALPRNTLNGAHRRTEQAALHLSGLSGLASRLVQAA